VQEKTHELTKKNEFQGKIVEGVEGGKRSSGKQIGSGQVSNKDHVMHKTPGKISCNQNDQNKIQAKKGHSDKEIIEHLKMRVEEDENNLLKFLHNKDSNKFRYQQNTLMASLLLDQIHIERSIMLQLIKHMVSNNFFLPKAEKTDNLEKKFGRSMEANDTTETGNNLPFLNQTIGTQKVGDKIGSVFEPSNITSIAVANSQGDSQGQRVENLENLDFLSQSQQLARLNSSKYNSIVLNQIFSSS